MIITEVNVELWSSMKKMGIKHISKERTNIIKIKLAKLIGR